MSRRRKPSHTRRHRKSVTAKRRARAFYKMRNSYGVDVLPPDEAKAMRPWRGCGSALFIMAAIAFIGWVVSEIFS